jgi:diadenosine tetraphosphate (Ap4A) HIT family hydrolase
MTESCIFCLRDDEELNTVMCENLCFFARYDNYPATDGHLEIVSKRHVESFFELTDQEIVEAYALLREAQQELQQKYEPHGYTIGVNEGDAAGRSIDHLHIHLIPRYYGDVEDPRGGVRQAAPNCDPDSWGAHRTPSG